MARVHQIPNYFRDFDVILSESLANPYTLWLHLLCGPARLSEISFKWNFLYNIIKTMNSLERSFFFVLRCELDSNSITVPSQLHFHSSFFPPFYLSVECGEERRKEGRRKTFFHSICYLCRSTTLLKSETSTTSSQSSRARPSIKEKYGLSNYNTSSNAGAGSRAGTPSSSSYYSPSAFTDHSKSSLSRRPSIKTIEDPSLFSLSSRRPSISRHYQPYQESTNRVPRPYSISYSPFDVSSINGGLRSARASPAREIGTSYSR